MAVLRLLLAIATALTLMASVATGATTGEVHRASGEMQVRLDGLFAQLKSARTDEEARLVEARIWQAWFHTDNGDVAQVMSRVHFAMRAGMLELALGELDKVVALDPDYAEGWNRRATVLFLLKRDRDSVRDIQRVLALEPRHFGALSGLGLIHMRAGNWTSALKSFRRAVGINPFLKERALIEALSKKVDGEPL